MNLNRAERRRIETHARLFEALRDELAENGLDATTVQAVTDRADVALGTFYNHFEDKEAAIAALAELELTALRTARASIDAHDEQLPRFITTSVAILGQKAAVDRRWIRFMDALAGGGWWPGPSIHARYVAFATDARQRGMIGHTDAEWSASTMEVLLAAYVGRLAAIDAEANLDAVISETLRTLLGALAVPPDVILEEEEVALSIPSRVEWPDASMVETSIQLGMSRI